MVFLQGLHDAMIVADKLWGMVFVLLTAPYGTD